MITELLPFTIIEIQSRQIPHKNGLNDNMVIKFHQLPFIHRHHRLLQHFTALLQLLLPRPFLIFLRCEYLATSIVLSIYAEE